MDITIILVIFRVESSQVDDIDDVDDVEEVDEVDDINKVRCQLIVNMLYLCIAEVITCWKTKQRDTVW